MDNAEQSPRPPSKGLFDTASLLGIPSPQNICKTSLLPNLVGVPPKKSNKVKSSDKESNHAKNSEKSKASSNSLTLPPSGISTVSGNQSVKTSLKNPSEPVNEQISRLLGAPEKPKRKRKPKAPKPDSAKNGKTEKQAKQPKEVKKGGSNSKTSLPSSGSLNHNLKPVPSPAHSSPLMPPLVPAKISTPDAKCDPEDEGFPLDLCMKKQEPTFEVTSSILSSYMPTLTNTASKKKPIFQPMISGIPGAMLSGVKPTPPKKRGRKPKVVQQVPRVPPVAHSEKNSIKDIASLLMPPKMDLLHSHMTNPSLLKATSSCPKVHAPNTLGHPNDIMPPSRKAFTLDCLLGETNGNMHFQDSDPNMFPTSTFTNKIFKHKERQRNNNRIKKIEEKIKEPESPLRPETSSPSDSDPDDDNSETDDSDNSESVTDGASTPSRQKRKHSYDEDGDEYSKKRRTVPDEREVQIPLEHGWRRETRIRCFSRSGVRGEVIYYTPCGKKLKSYPEVVRYLIKNGITDISRDNFTFSTKVNVGDFLECTSSGSGQDYILLNENEVAARIEEVKAQRGRLGVQHRKSSQHRNTEEEEQQRQWEQKQMQHHLEQQAKFREAQEMKLLRQAQKEQALVVAREEKRMRAEESRKQKEQQRIMKQQEKFERMEQLRMEKEIRAQQILEDQEMKRQQAVFLREQERERRRQHMILVRALENRKKQEERERKREEILYEKRVNREKKLEQRRIELDYLRELKKPVDDMMLKDLMPLPTLNRIPGVKLCGKAFADILMVFEFLHNFGETLGFDMDSLPTLNTLQTALLNLDEKCEEELLSVVHHLLVCVIDDPGVPHNQECATVLGQSLKDADITNSNVSEVLRLFFIAQDKRVPMLEWLQSKPFLSLNASQKAEIIAYLCDELLTSRLLMRQVDSNIEHVNVLRKDKWLVEGDLRRYRSIQQRRALKARLSAMEENKDNPNCANMLSADLPDFSLANLHPKDNPADDSDLKDKSDKEKLEEMENELANESGNESDDTQAPGQMSDNEDEDLHLSNDEINKKIDKLSKQLTQCSNKLTKAFYTIRGATFGMDRYHRRYWVFPKSGGVYVESMESSLKDEEREKVLNESKEPPVKQEEETDSVEENKEIDCKEKKDETLEKIEDKTNDEEKVVKMDTSMEEKDIEENTEKEVKASSKKVKASREKELESSSENKAKANSEKEIKANSEKEIEANSEKEVKANSEKEVKANCEKEIKSSSEEEVKANSEEVKGNNEEEESILVSQIVVKSEKVEAEESENSEIKMEIDNVVVKSEKDVDKDETAMEVNCELDVKPEVMKDLSSEKDSFDTEKKKEESPENSVATSESNEHKTPEKNSLTEPALDSKDENLSKSLPNKKEESKSLAETLASPIKMSSTPEKKSSKNSDNFPNLKKEIKSRRDRHKEGDNKYSDIKEEKKPNVNIFMPNLCDSSINLDLGAPQKMHGSDRQHPPNPSIPPDQSWLFNSPLFASILAGNMLFNGPMMPQRDMNGTYFNLPKNDSNNPFGPFLGLQPGMLSAEQIFKSLGEKPVNQKPWFSILPRMPCDESLLSTPQRNSSMHSGANVCPQMAPRGGVSNAPPGQVANALSNLQMELMNGVVPPGFFLHPFLPPQFGSTYQNNQAPCSSTMSSPMPDFNLNFGRPPAASTPNSIPTPSATPGPCATPTSRDSPSPNFTKRLMMEKLAQEYEAPQPIPPELQRGWWRITDPHQLKQVISALHNRGVREKMFQKVLQKHFTFACTSCSLGQGKETDLEITDLDKDVSKCIGGAPDPDSPESWNKNIALRVDMTILEQIENLEEKVDGSSMQVKNWKPPSKLSTESINKFIPSCEQYVYRNFNEIYDAIKERQQRKSVKKSSSRKKKPQKKEQEQPEPEPEHSEQDPAEKKPEDENMDTTAEAETVTESAELNESVTEDPDKSIAEESSKPESDFLPLPPGKLNPVEEAKKRLLKVEAAIERRYLKPPLGTRSQISGNATSTNPPPTDSSEEENIPVGLVKWRNAVQNCRTAAQLAMCLNFLENFTAWDKSIMRASCQFCHSGDNEEKLLLCDGCDKGYHTYCFKPVMETIPEGDWYCFECLNKATGDNVCVICGTKGKLVECEACPKTFHLNCLDPPLAKMPKGKWYCSGCSLTRPKKNTKKSAAKLEKEAAAAKEKEAKEAATEKTPKKAETEKPEKKTKTSEKKKKSEEKKKEKEQKEKEKEKEKEAEAVPSGSKDFAPCSIILDEMQQHEDAWPFLTPVNTKQFPTYKKVIKKPMDMATIKNKLDAGQYKTREDFATDTRLIFDNCETFNEDESPVGQAGHSMRAYFETRWSDLCST